MTAPQAPAAESQFKSPVRHLLVDLDGTLLGNQSLPLSIDFVRKAIGALKQYGGVRKAAKVLFAIQSEFKRPSVDLTNDNRIVALFAEQMNLSLDEARRVLREGISMIFPGLKRHFYPVEGAKEFLEWARANYSLTLATNPVWPPEIVEMRVQWAGIDPKIFGSMTHVRRMRACKPTREYYSQILRDEGFKAEDTLLIGDDVKMDLPATRLGIRVYIVGKYSAVKPLKVSGQLAPAWRGSYPALRALLERDAEQGVTT